MNIANKNRSNRLLTQVLLLAILVSASWLLWPSGNERPKYHPQMLPASTTQPCIGIFPQNETYQDDAIQKPGSYCALSDFSQQELHGAGHSGPSRGHTLVYVSSGDASINLQGHTLHTAAVSDGIANFRRVKNITIRNGVIDLRGIGTGVRLTNNWNMTFIDAAPPSGVNIYEKTKFVLENLVIKTDNIGIMLEGDGNIIRNCTIESGGDAAIIMAGPNGRIMNNTIVLENPFIPAWLQSEASNEIIRKYWELPRYRSMTRAAVVSHQATGTVISGNRIEVKGKSATRHNIYLTDASENVRIEGNTFVGSDDPVTLVKGSTAILKNNVFEQRKPWWKF